MKLFFKKACIIIVCLILAISLSTSSVYAAETLMKIARQKEGPQGGTVLFRIELTNLTGSGKKISSFNGYVNLDKEVFEPITVNSIVKETNGKVKIAATGEELEVYDLTQATPEEIANTSNSGVFFNGNPSSGNDCKIMIDLGTDITEDTVLLTLKLKIKDNAKVGTYDQAIEVKDFQLYYQATERADINSQYYPVTVTAKAEQPDNAVENNTVENNAVENKDKDKDTNNTADDKDKDTDNPGSTDKDKDNQGGQNKNDNDVVKDVDSNGKSGQESQTPAESTDKTVAQKVLPAAGTAISIALPVIVLVVIAYVCYAKYLKIKDIK